MRDDIAFFRNGLGQLFAWLGGLHLYGVCSAVNADLRKRVDLLDGTTDRFFAMTAGHAGDGKGLDHEKNSGFKRVYKENMAYFEPCQNRKDEASH
jgi:hypothetical protein